MKRSAASRRRKKVTPEDELRFISAMLAELGDMASRRGANFLTYLLGMAGQEASYILDGSRPKEIRAAAAEMPGHVVGLDRLSYMRSASRLRLEDSGIGHDE